MAWKKLVFKQNQPIHVGSGKWGVVKETAVFIPGQTMWGALTNLYSQRFSPKEENVSSIFENISNFFPSLDEKDILKPHYQDGEFCLGDFSEREFRAYFVDTLVQTAVEPLSRKAKDESLHEIDYILPKPKREFQNIENLKKLRSNLFWIGIVNVEDEVEEDFLKKGLKIFVGADVKYGYGELELINTKPLNNEDKEFWWIKDEKIEIQTKEPSPYFIDIEAWENVEVEVEFEGELIPLIESNFLQNTPVVEEAKFFLNVGSKLSENKNEDKEEKIKATKGIALKKGKLKVNS